jgi:hypothetical protein
MVLDTISNPLSNPLSSPLHSISVDTLPTGVIFRGRNVIFDPDMPILKNMYIFVHTTYKLKL